MSSVKLILVDNMMPGMTGLEFLKYCRMDSALNAIPKIMITADDSIQDQVKAFKAGAYDYIEKPLMGEILSARVEHVMEISSRMFLYDSVANDCMHFAERDMLTGLINKVTFREIVDRIIRIDSDSHNALLVVDIDNFKNVNDSYGHMTGDKAIRCIGDTLKDAFRKTDIVGRFGGDEFVVMMTQLSNKSVARRKAEEVTKSAMYACLKQLHLDISISIGIAFSTETDTHDSMFERADRALYEAKRTGKAKVVVDGEQVPAIEDDCKPVIAICSENSQVYPTIALAYGNSASFANITSFAALKECFEKYHDRIAVVCLDMQKKAEIDSDEFYRFIIENGGGVSIPILAFCRDGDVEQIREALKLNIMDILALPPQIDVLQHKITAAIANASIGRLCAMNPIREKVRH